MPETSKSFPVSSIALAGGTASTRQKPAFSLCEEMRKRSQTIAQFHPGDRASLSFDRLPGKSPKEDDHRDSSPFRRKRMLRRGQNVPPCPNCDNGRKTSRETTWSSSLSCVP